jgi:hypothetical protein
MDLYELPRGKGKGGRLIRGNKQKNQHGLAVTRANK